MKKGDKVYVPVLKTEVVVTEVVNGKPVEGTFIDHDGVVKVVNLLTTAYEVLTLIRKIIIIIKSLFK